MKDPPISRHNSASLICVVNTDKRPAPTGYEVVRSRIKIAGR